MGVIDTAVTFDHLDATGCKEYWRAGYTGKGFVVAVIDSGVNAKHVDLAGRARPCVSLCGYGVDDTGHGSHVAGLIAGAKSGVAPGAELLPIKVVNDNKGTVTRLIEGLNAALDNRVDAVCMSLSMSERACGKHLDGLREAVRALDAAGVPVFCAAGNQGKSPDRRYPAEFDEPFVVASALKSRKTANTSARRGTVDFCQRGDSLWSVSHKSNTGYAKKSGTSMATPIACGLAVLVMDKLRRIRGAKPSCAELYAALTACCVDLGDRGRDADYGCGFLTLDICK